MPFDSPVPNSPKPDDYTESVRSPRVPRSPMVPAIRIAGRRQSIPRFKRQDDSPAPTPAPDGSDAADAETVNAQGLLGGLGDALDGLLHQVEGLANGLPIIGGLGILSDDGSTPPSPDPAAEPSSSPSQPQKRQDSQSATPQTPTNQAQQAMAMLIQQQQQAAAALRAATAGMPIDPFTLQQQLQALQQQQLSGLPLAGNALGGNGLGGLGLLSTVGGLAGGLPVVGGLLGSNGLVGGLLGDVQGDLSGLLGATGLGNLLGGVTGTADGLLGGLLGGSNGGNGQANLLEGILGGGSGNPQSESYHAPAHYPDANGFYPHSFSAGPLTVPPNSPTADPAALAFGSFAVDDAGDNVASALSAPSSTSVPMDHDHPSPSSVVGAPMEAAPTETAPTETASMSAPAPTPSSTLPRRRIEGDVIAPVKRSDCNGVPESAMHEGGCDAVPGPQDAVKKTLTGPRLKKMIRRRLRGLSVGF